MQRAKVSKQTNTKRPKTRRSFFFGCAFHLVLRSSQKRASTASTLFVFRKKHETLTVDDTQTLVSSLLSSFPLTHAHNLFTLAPGNSLVPVHVVHSSLLSSCRHSYASWSSANDRAAASFVPCPPPPFRFPDDESLSGCNFCASDLYLRFTSSVVQSFGRPRIP